MNSNDVASNGTDAPASSRWSRPGRFDRFAGLIVAGLVALYSAYFSLFTCIQHGRLKTYAFDLGTFDQGIWLAGHGTNYFVTVRGLHLLGDHVRAFSFVLAPLYWIWDDVRALLVAQSVAIAAGAWFVFRIASHAAPRHVWFGVAIAASWLLHPGNQNLNLDHAHPDAFATTLIVAAMYFLRTGRTLAFWIAMLLAMSCKEDVPLVFMALGCAMIVERLARRTGGAPGAGQPKGGAILAVSGTYFALCMLVILPYFNGQGFFRFDEHYFLGGMGTHHTEPAWFVQRLLRAESAHYLFSLGAPLGFLFLVAPWTLVPALPSLAVNLLSDADYMRSYGYHYQTWIMPFLYIGTIDAFVRLSSSVVWRRVAARVLPALILGATVAANLAWAKVPLDNLGDIVARWKFLRSDPELARIHRLIAKLPPEASISADYSLVPHLSHREHIYLFPNPYRAHNWGILGENTHDPDSVEYVVVRNLPGSVPLEDTVNQLVGEGWFRLVEGDSKFGLYRRTEPVALSERSTCGDWNGDGNVTQDDMRVIASAIMREKPCPLPVCDADGDGRAAYGDVLRIAKRARGDSVPLGCPAATSR